MMLKKLPQTFQQNPLITTIARLLQDRKIIFSSIVYCNGPQQHIINKNPQTPYFPQDWQCYSFLRCLSRTLITTGSIVRYQKDLFKSRFCCGDKLIEQMYDNFKKQSQIKDNVFVMTNSMKKQQILTYFNHVIYNVIVKQNYQEFNNKNINLNDVLEMFNSKNNEQYKPILVECGPTVLKEYFDNIINEKKYKNLIDGAYIAYFEGKMPQHSIGNVFCFEQKLYENIWTSQKIDVFHKNQNIGKVHFKVFHKKEE